MSFFKATWWRPVTALAVLAVAVVGILSLTGAGTVHAGSDGSVSVSPADLQIGAGGSGMVDVVLTPGSAGVSVWIIQIAYDPAVAQVAVDSDNHPVCTSVSVQSPLVGAGGCFTKAVNHGSTPDTLVALGGVVQNGPPEGTPIGFTTQQTLATFTFKAVGAAGANTPLTTTVTSLLDPNGATPAAAVSNGAIDIIASQGQSIIWGDVDCNGSIGPRDGQGILKNVLEQPALSQTEPCPDVGTTVTVDGTSEIWGDADCNGSVGPRDGQGILKNVLEQPALSQTEPCPDIGTTVQVVG